MSAMELERVFHALSDPSRLAIVERLSRAPASVKELAAPLPMALPSVMKHLKVLEEGGVVRSQKSGRVRTYEINASMLSAIDAWVAARKAAHNRAFDRLERLLDNGEDQ